MAAMKSTEKFLEATKSQKWLHLYKESAQENFVSLLAEPIKLGHLTEEGKALNAKGKPEYVTGSNISRFREDYKDTPEMLEAVNKAYDASIKKVGTAAVSFSDVLEHERVVSETWALKFKHDGKTYVLAEVLQRIREPEKNPDGSENEEHISWDSELAKAALNAATSAEAPSFQGGELYEGTTGEQTPQQVAQAQEGAADLSEEIQADEDRKQGIGEKQERGAQARARGSAQPQSAAAQNFEMWLKKGKR